MYRKPDYATARNPKKFSWSASGSYLSCLALSGVPLRDFFLKPDACIEAYRVGREKQRQLFDPQDVSLPSPATPPVSYGHANGLGARLFFPEGGEVAVEHCFAHSLEEAMEALARPVDFASAGMAPFYLDFREQMMRAFPGESVGFSFGAEGPCTTAYELRGDAFFVDVMEEPARTKDLLSRINDSILGFEQFRLGVTGGKVFNESNASLCDDIAAMIPPRLWNEFVLPFWSDLFCRRTTGDVHAHVEDLKPAHLPFLEQIGLSYYDPSISHHLNPRIIADKCRVPFGWRLGGIHLPVLDAQDVEDFVFQSAADGASRVFTILEANSCSGENIPKIDAFIRAAKEVKRLLDEGCPRRALADHVSERGRHKFWDNWCS